MDISVNVILSKKIWPITTQFRGFVIGLSIISASFSNINLKAPCLDHNLDLRFTQIWRSMQHEIRQLSNCAAIANWRLSWVDYVDIGHLACNYVLCGESASTIGAAATYLSIYSLWIPDCSRRLALLSHPTQPDWMPCANAPAAIRVAGSWGTLAPNLSMYRCNIVRSYRHKRKDTIVAVCYGMIATLWKNIKLTIIWHIG